MCKRTVSFLSITIATLCLIQPSQSLADIIVDISSYSSVYYVSESGDDSNSGSEANPFATVHRAVASAGASGDAIVIGAGQFDVTQIGPVTHGSETGLNNAGKDVDFIGVPNATILNIDGVSNLSRDIHFYSGKGFSRVYNMKFVRNSNNRSTNYSNAIFGSNGSVQGEFYNSVFKSVNSPNTGLTYDNTNLLDIDVYNSVFDLEGDFVSSYTGSNVNLVNSVSNVTFKQPDGGNSYTNVLSDAVFDADYRILSDPVLWEDVGAGLDRDGSIADLGVHGSQFSWAPVTAVPEPSSLFLLGVGLIGMLRLRRRQ